MRVNIKLIVILFIAGITGVTSCKKDIPQHNIPKEEDLVAGRISGTWAMPSNMVTPANVPPDVFGTMRLVFTTDEAGKPAKFMAQNSPIIFGNTGIGSWTVAGTQDSALVNLVGVGPVDEVKVKVTTSTLTLSFFMGWENTDTKATGQGDFSVTLTRQ
ncbi:MAG TPA: hypothetical protein PKV73_08920 [Agriterribacter sp.]|nr:hypothetical protein [Chitinophagaceae bacterium]HRP32001.1 hypothetical protein [Agriterribacter sp.]